MTRVSGIFLDTDLCGLINLRWYLFAPVGDMERKPWNRWEMGVLSRRLISDLIAHETRVAAANGAKRNQTIAHREMIVIANVSTENLKFAEPDLPLDAPVYLDREDFPLGDTFRFSRLHLGLLNKRSLDGVKERHDDLCAPFTRDASSRMSNS